MHSTVLSNQHEEPNAGSVRALQRAGSVHLHCREMLLPEPVQGILALHCSCSLSCLAAGRLSPFLFPFLFPSPLKCFDIFSKKKFSAQITPDMLQVCCRWLASKGRQQAAEDALRSLRGPDSIQAELDEMQPIAQSQPKQSLWHLLRSPVTQGELKVGEPWLAAPLVVSRAYEGMSRHVCVVTAWLRGAV